MSTHVLAPPRVGDAIRHLTDHDGAAALIAGGTHWMVRQARGLDLPAVLVRLDAVAGLADIRRAADGSLLIGAMARMSSLERSPIVLEQAPALVEVIRSIATPGIRTQATIGGNLALANPAHDPPAILVALDAIVRLEGPDGYRDMPLDQWITGPATLASRPHEILVAVIVPPISRRSAARYRATVTGSGVDAATAAAAVRVDLDADGVIADARIVLGSAGAVPARCGPVEASLLGRRPTRELAAEAVGLVPPTPAGAAPVGGHDVRRTLAVAVARQALVAAFEDLLPGDPPPTRA